MCQPPENSLVALFCISLQTRKVVNQPQLFDWSFDLSFGRSVGRSVGRLVGRRSASSPFLYAPVEAKSEEDGRAFGSAPSASMLPISS